MSSNSSITPKGETEKTSKISVMLVDDSSIIRASLARIIERDPDISVISSVANGELGVSSAKNNQPDVVILDIEMPVMDGLEALPKILEVSPKSKVIMFSTLTEKGASVSLKAFSLGAVECLVKPSSTEAAGENSEFERRILSLIKGFYPDKSGAGSSPGRSDASGRKPAKISTGGRVLLRKDPMAYQGKPKLIAIGSSTGGPQALFDVIEHFKGFDVPIVITQHMPATFTKILAEHITQKTGVPSFEGEDGMSVENGNAYVAPGGQHMLLTKDDGRLRIKLDDGPAENFCKPAVDPMYRSVTKIFGNQVLGVILTGMGSDGLKGAEELVTNGGRLIAQDEKSSVVWGMPGAVAEAGLCTEVLPLAEIGPWVRKAVLG